jgi:hypothetical protein
VVGKKTAHAIRMSAVGSPDMAIKKPDDMTASGVPVVGTSLTQRFRLG